MDTTTLSVGYQDAYKAIQGDEERPLEDLYNIESAISLIKKDEDRIEQYKALKKKRAEQIDVEIKKLEARVSHMKNIILLTLNDKKEKSVKFPGVGSVNKRKIAAKWEISDEEKLLEVLKKRNELNNCTKTKIDIVKKDLNKLLDMWHKSDEVPKDCINRVDEGESITVKYDVDIDTSETPDIDDVPVPKKNDQDLDFTK